MENALVTGGSGMVGRSLNQFRYRPTSDEMDITNRQSIEQYVASMEAGPSCIIHLAALNLRDCEKDATRAVRVNINGTTNMLAIAMKLQVSFVLISSGAVFASRDPAATFDEECVTNPNCMYGETKAAAEKVALLYDKTILIRTGWLYGAGDSKKHHKLVEQAIQKLTSNECMNCTYDMYGSLTLLEDLTNHMIHLINTKNYGIHHVVNGGSASALDIVNFIAEKLPDGDAEKYRSLTNSISNADMGTSARSNSEVLITCNTINQLRNWQDALKEYLLLPKLRQLVRSSGSSIRSSSGNGR